MRRSDLPLDPPLVAILRGLEPERAADVASALFDAGFRIVEVPLNRPGALQGIATIVRMAPADALVGGGTMLTPADVDAVHVAGGRLMVSPNFDAAVIAAPASSACSSHPAWPRRPRPSRRWRPARTC